MYFKDQRCILYAFWPVGSVVALEIDKVEVADWVACCSIVAEEDFG